MKRFIIFMAASMLLAITALGAPSSWAQEEVDAAKDAGIITEATGEHFQGEITREQFCELVIKLYEKLTDTVSEPGEDVFLDTDNPEILKAYELGIVKGVSESEFAPEKYITRQEICVMLTRCIDVAIDSADITDFNDNDFQDKSEIATWAHASVNYAYDHGVMKGIGDNFIGPHGFTTCEQAIILAYRICLNRESFETKPAIEEIGEYQEGLAVFRCGEKYGFIDESGEIAIRAKYDWAEGFSEGLAMVRSGDWDTGRCGFIDRVGNLVIAFEFEEARNFREGLAAIRTGGWSEGKYGFINKAGNIVIKPEFDMVGDFHEGLAVIRIGNELGSKYGYIDTEGNIVIEPQFDYAGDFENGIAVVFVLDENGGETFAINTLGERV